MRIPPDFLVSGSAASPVGPFSKVTQQVWSGMSASLPLLCFVLVVLPSCVDLFGSTLSRELHAPLPVVLCCSSLLLLQRSIPLSLDAPSQPSSHVGHLNSLQITNMFCSLAQSSLSTIPLHVAVSMAFPNTIHLEV